MEPSDVGTPAYWKLIVSVLQPAGAVGPGPLQESRERDWSVIIRAIALLGELHAPRVPLGHALASVGFSELRFVRLLRASGARLFDETIATARFLAAKGADVNALHLAQLVLTDTKESGEDIRRSIARSYYGTSLTPSAKEQNK